MKPMLRGTGLPSLKEPKTETSLPGFFQVKATIAVFYEFDTRYG